jgi:hypothetical protein
MEGETKKMKLVRPYVTHNFMKEMKKGAAECEMSVIDFSEKVAPEMSKIVEKIKPVQPTKFEKLMRKQIL